MKIGILALQGDYAAHGRVLQQLNIEWQSIRSTDELSTVDGLIIPGGESTTLLKLLNGEFISEIKALPSKNKPIFGTCAGAILLAKHVTHPKQTSLGLVDITIERNAYGRQLDSQIGYGDTTLQETPLEMVFIRAPRITQTSEEVKTIARFLDQPTCVQQGLNMVATFHPELSTNHILHQHFVELVKDTKKET